MNILLGKKVIENWNNPEVMTNGEINNYTGGTGFSCTTWPDTLTIDLETVRKIKCIRFLLWDGLGNNNTVRDNRKYRYRLLSSEDGNNWKVHFDTLKDGYNGWQQFIFDNTIDVRFIRIHALHNSANGEFHIVEIQAFENDFPKLNTEITVNKHFTSITPTIEVGDGLPITDKILSIAQRLKNVVEQNSYLNPEPFNKIIEDLRTQSTDIKVIEGNIESLKRVILDPVENELKKGARINRFSIWGFVVGLIGIIVSIVTMIIK